MKRTHPASNGGKWIRSDKRLAIYLRDGFVCLYCLRDLHGVDPRDLTLDHLKCVSDGGNNRSTNLVLACRACNSSRGDQPVTRFAGPETLKHIRRNTRRKLASYLGLARAIIAGDTDLPQNKETK